MACADVQIVGLEAYFACQPGGTLSAGIRVEAANMAIAALAEELKGISTVTCGDCPDPEIGLCAPNPELSVSNPPTLVSMDLECPAGIVTACVGFDGDFYTYCEPLCTEGFEPL